MVRGKQNLGLPIEYIDFPEYFDDHNVFENTAAKNLVIANLLEENKAKTVLDMTCGTGSQVFFLKNLGYDIVGSDFSKPLIEIAKKRALDQKLDVKFIEADVRTFEYGAFDAVITIFNSIGHLTKQDFKRAINNISKNLKANGIYIFDIINPKALTDEILNHGVDRAVHNNEIINYHNYKFDRKNNIISCYENITITKDQKKPRKLKNQFSLQLYEASEIDAILNENGFDVLKQCDIEGGNFVEEFSLNILTLAKKR